VYGVVRLATQPAQPRWSINLDHYDAGLIPNPNSLRWQCRGLPLDRQFQDKHCRGFAVVLVIWVLGYLGSGYSDSGCSDSDYSAPGYSVVWLSPSWGVCRWPRGQKLDAT